MGVKGQTSLALYRKYRSRTLDEVLGQDHVTTILKRALKKGKIAHAYLLTGPRGTGKTSVARILAHEINQLPYSDDATHLDIIEIDAASNNGVDDIRSLREKARVAPASAKKKIYIIDEVHMLSKAAFNALLKTLEEPPEHVVFIMATTDADKLPATILSRVQQYYFHPISSSVIAKHLINIAKKEGFELKEAAAELIAERSRGGFRDSLSLLDQLSSLASKTEPLGVEQVSASLGLADQELIEQLIAAHKMADTATTLKTLQALEDQGSNPLIITQQILSVLRKKLAKEPSLTKLIGELIEVTKHPHPDLKLLTVLASYQVTNQTTPPQPHISQATLKVTKKEKVVKIEPTKPSTAPETPQPKSEETPKKSPPKPTSDSTPDSFDWQQFVEDIRQKSIALYSLVAKCGHTYSDGTLTLYGGTSFTHKKLDDSKNRLGMSEVIQARYGDGIEITITSDKKPPEDEQLAAVAAMMGGGEEVNLEDIS